MKKILILIFCNVLLIQFSSALCSLTPTLINQDPISAVPGETVKLIFQITGVENPECSTINLEFLEEYPFTLEQGQSKIQTVKGGTYQRDFNSFWMVPYKVRVDSHALDGDQKLSLKTWAGQDSKVTKITDFNISIEEVRTDFIITLDGYSFSTNKLTLGLVNIGKKSAQATTVKIPRQDNVLVDGGNVKILGELDSNDDTTITFDAVLSSGQIIIEIEYNDEIGKRRFLSKEVYFNDLDFESTRKKSTISIGSIFLWVIIIGVIVYLYLSRRRTKHHIQYLTKHSSKSPIHNARL